jgi:hypothetical protein
MNQVNDQAKAEFARVVLNVSRRRLARMRPVANLVLERGISETTRSN